MASILPQEIRRNDLTVSNDDMEISSDAGRGADDSADAVIDFDGPWPLADDDDLMIEDDPTTTKADSTQPNTLPSDSMMFDGGDNDELQDDGMMDDEPEFQDEELLDASDSEDQDAEITELPTYDQTDAKNDAGLEEGDITIDTNEVTEKLDDEATLLPEEEQVPDAEQIPNNAHLRTEAQVPTDDEAEDEINYVDAEQAELNEDSNKYTATKAENDTDLFTEIHETSRVENYDSEHEGATTTLSEHAKTEQPFGDAGKDADTTVQAEKDAHLSEEGTGEEHQNLHHDDGPATVTSTDSKQEPGSRDEDGLQETEPHIATYDVDSDHSQYKSHPVIVLYEDTEIHLFPPGESDISSTYFLSDETLVDASLKDLFSGIRNVLGNSVTENEELELEIGVLGLTINENSSEATLSTLASVLDVYCRLCHIDQSLDDSGSPYPLQIFLHTTARFSARISQMYDLIEDGKGLSYLHTINGSAEDHQPVHNQINQDTNESIQEPAESLDHTDGLAAFEQDATGRTYAEDREENDEIAYAGKEDLSTDRSNKKISAEEPISFEAQATLANSSNEPNNFVDDLASEDATRETGKHQSLTHDAKENPIEILQHDDKSEFDKKQTSEYENVSSRVAEDIHDEVHVEVNHDDTLVEQQGLSQASAEGEAFDQGDFANPDLSFDQIDTGDSYEQVLDEFAGDDDDVNAHEDDGFQVNEEQWHDQDDSVLEHEEQQADDLEDELDASEFLHEDEQEADLDDAEANDVDDPTTSTLAAESSTTPTQSVSKKRSFAEHDAEDEGADNESTSKKVKPT